MKFSLCLILLFAPSFIFAGWHDRKAEGWAWHEDPKDLDSEEESETSEEEDLGTIRKALEEKLETAILHPTDENVLAYMQEQKKWVDKSALFASLWSQILLNNPRLDETVMGRPVTRYGIQLHKTQLLHKREELIANLAQNQGLFFFYEGKSPISAHVGSVVQLFSKKYGWRILAVSVDGEILEDFPQSKKDNGISTELGIDTFPALVAVDAKQNVITPIAYGLFSAEKIEENILLQFSSEEGSPQ